MEWWVLGAVAGAIVSVAYFAISYVIFRGIARTRQSRSNPLAVATGAIFFSCGGGHAIHVSHMLLPIFGLDLATGLAAREAFSEWHVWGWELSTAAVAAWYWSLRHRFPALIRGTQLFEDVRERQRNALHIHDSIVQGLAKAKTALDLDRPEQTREELERTLENARAVVSGLLGDIESQRGIQPGDLRIGTQPT